MLVSALQNSGWPDEEMDIPVKSPSKNEIVVDSKLVETFIEVALIY